jgi:cobalt/nickel transport protein
MKPQDRNLIIAVVILCLVIGVLAPFIASPNPDGLEKSAEQLMPGGGETEGVVSPPFPDYGIESLGKMGEIIAMFIGIFVTLIFAYVVAKLIGRRKTPPETSK